MKYTFSLIAGFFFLLASAQQPAPAKKQEKSIVLAGGHIHVGNGEVIEHGKIYIKDGKITLVEGPEENIRDGYDTIIDVEGKHVYPGFISPNSRLGLVEIGAVRSTRDFDDVGKMNPHVRSIVAYNTDSRVTPTVRTNGVLLAQITPTGGTISGASSVVELDAWNWEDAVYREDDGIHLNWPDQFKRSGWWAEPGSIEKNKEYEDEVQLLKTFFENSKAYAEIKNQEEKNLRYEAMRDIFQGTKNLYIHANQVKSITEAVLFAKDFLIKNLIIVGGRDSWMLTDFLKKNRVAVILQRPHSLPGHPEDDVDLPYKTPALLQEGGVLFCLENAGDMETFQTRNLPFFAGTAAAYGLSKEQALQSITLNTAKILGIADRVGSLEAGKDATLFISTGDALDMRTNNVELAFIRGKNIDLNNEQKRLYETYRKKYGQEQ